MSDRKNFLGADVVVEINSSYETMMLYKEFVEKCMSYKQDMGGYMVTVGKLDGRPICVTPHIHTIDGVKVLYVEATSQVVDWVMIENWIKSVVKEGTGIVSNPINLMCVVQSKAKDIRDGKLKKHIRVNMGSETPHYIKKVTFNVDGRNHVTTTTDQFEAVYDCPLKLETIIDTLNKHVEPLVDGESRGFDIFDIY